MTGAGNEAGIAMTAPGLPRRQNEADGLHHDDIGTEDFSGVPPSSRRSISLPNQPSSLKSGVRSCEQAALAADGPAGTTGRGEIDALPCAADTRIWKA